MKSIRWSLTIATIIKKGLLVNKNDKPFIPSHECIVVVTQQVLDGLLTATNIQFAHPTSSDQLKDVTNHNLHVRQDQLHHLMTIPTVYMEQSACPLPSALQVSITTDVIIKSAHNCYSYSENESVS